MYVRPEVLRHDALTARAARTLREVDPAPDDWLERPAEHPERLEVPGDERDIRVALDRLLLTLAGIGVAGLALVGVVTLVEGLR